MMQNQRFDVSPYWEFVKRRKWWIVFPFFSILLLGFAYMYYTPKVYKASSLILLEDQSISESYVGDTSGSALEDRLQLITQKIHSRSNLKQLIETFDFNIKQYEDKHNILASLGSYLSSLPFIAEGEASPQQSSFDKNERAAIEQLRSKIEVEFSRDDERAFEISFLWNDPVVAADFANKIAEQFIEQNNRSRQEKATGTTEFLNIELVQLRDQLAKKENELEQFRKNHIGMLPEQLETNIDLMNQARDELDSLNERLDLERQRAMMLTEGVRRGARIPVASSEDEFASLVEELEALRSKYTSRHPDVIALQNRMQKMLGADSRRAGAESSRDQQDTGFVGGDADFTYQTQLAQARAQIDSYRKQIRETEQELREYQARVEQSPNVEMQLRELQRDYNTLNERYQDILARKLDAQMAEELERRQKGEQFTVVDSAMPPLVPFEPDMRKVGFMTLLLGLSFGGGLAYLRESMDPAFFSAEDAESVLGRKVLVSLPWHRRRE